jgi:hypothetical protein
MFGFISRRRCSGASENDAREEGKEVSRAVCEVPTKSEREIPKAGILWDLKVAVLFFSLVGNEFVRDGMVIDPSCLTDRRRLASRPLSLPLSSSSRRRHRRARARRRCGGGRR